jgi:hypothetical protein
LVEPSRLPQGPHLVLLERTLLLFAPAFTPPYQYCKDALHSAGFIPQRRDHCGAPPFRLKRARCEVRGPHILPMPSGHLQVMEAGRALVSHTAAGFGKRGLIWLDQVMEAPLPFVKRRGVPQVGHQGLARWPGLRGHLLGQMLQLMKPAPHPQSPRPHRVNRFDAPWGAIRRDGHRRLEPALEQIPSHLQTTLIAFTLGRREGQEDFPPLDTDTPDTQDTGFTPPAPSGCVDGVHTERRHVIAPEVPRPKRLVLLTQRVRSRTDSTLRAHALTSSLLQGHCNVALGPPTDTPLHNERLQPVTGRREIGP